jgi:hypothetical protein
LAKIDDSNININLNFTNAWRRLKRNKILFVFEFLDNIIEESEWFWGVYVFIIIGSLSTPGIVGSLEAIGGSLFTLIIGKFADKNGKLFVPLAALALILISITRIFVNQPINAYIITVIASFILNIFLVSYFSTIYKTIKNDNEEEFMILREIPTVLGRMVVFGVILLTLPYLRYFFILPIIITTLLLCLYFLKKRYLAV